MHIGKGKQENYLTLWNYNIIYIFKKFVSSTFSGGKVTKMLPTRSPVINRLKLAPSSFFSRAVNSLCIIFISVLCSWDVVSSNCSSPRSGTRWPRCLGENIPGRSSPSKLCLTMLDAAHRFKQFWFIQLSSRKGLGRGCEGKWSVNNTKNSWGGRKIKYIYMGGGEKIKYIYIFFVYCEIRVK